MPLGNSRLVSTLTDLTVRRKPQQARRLGLFAAKQIVPKMTDVSPPLGIRHHIVGIANRQATQVSDGGKAVPIEAERLTVLYSNNEEATIG